MELLTGAPLFRRGRSVAVIAALVLATMPLRAQEASGSAAASATVAPLPSVTLPAPLDRVLRDYERCWRAGDVQALAALFTADGFVLSNGQPAVRGRDGIARAYAGQRGPLVLRALAYATGDSVGYIIGAYTYEPAQGDQGKFTLTLRREGRGTAARWLIASDMDNSVRPRRP